MSEQNTQPAVGDDLVKQLQEQLKTMESRIEAVDTKNRELLDEKKKATDAKKLADEELEKERLKKSGDIDKLLAIEKEKTEKAEKEKQDLLAEIKEEKVKTLSLQLASEMKGKPESIEILANCVEKEISSLVDSKGNMSDVARKTIIQNFKESSKYKPLLLGNQSTGGGAEGSSGDSAAKSLSDMTEAEQIALHKSDPVKWKQLVSGK